MIYLAALEYFKENIDDEINVDEFEKSCGINISYTIQDIKNVIEEKIINYKDNIIKMRQKFNSGRLLGEVLSELKWANSKDVKEIIDMNVYLIIIINI